MIIPLAQKSRQRDLKRIKRPGRMLLRLHLPMSRLSKDDWSARPLGRGFAEN